MQFTGLQFCGFFVLLISTALLITAAASNYWSKECPDSGIEIVNNLVADVGLCFHRGLWKKGCLYDSEKKLDQQLKESIKSGCWNNILDMAKEKKYEKIQKHFEVWEFSVIVLMLLASLTAFVALVLAPCCSSCILSELSFALLCDLASIGVYAYFTMNQESVVTEFLWSFYVAVGGAAGLLLAITIFAVGRSQADRYAHYSHPA